MEEALGMGTASRNLINICVEKSINGEIGGEFYCCYFDEPQKFDNIVQLLRLSLIHI